MSIVQTKYKAIEMIMLALALLRFKMSWWHRIAHLFGDVQESYDLYVKNTNDQSVYSCYRCDHCSFPRQEKKISKTKYLGD